MQNTGTLLLWVNTILCLFVHSYFFQIYCCEVILLIITPSSSCLQFLHLFVPLGLLNVQWFSISPSVWSASPMASLHPALPGLKIADLSTQPRGTLRLVIPPSYTYYICEEKEHLLKMYRAMWHHTVHDKLC